MGGTSNPDLLKIAPKVKAKGGKQAMRWRSSIPDKTINKLEQEEKDTEKWLEHKNWGGAETGLGSHMVVII